MINVLAYVPLRHASHVSTCATGRGFSLIPPFPRPEFLYTTPIYVGSICGGYDEACQCRRADRRQAAQQRQEREREEQQSGSGFERLCDREPKASVTRATPALGTLRYLNREIGPVDSHGDRFDISLERSDERATRLVRLAVSCLSPLSGLRRQDGVRVLHSER